MGGIAFGGSGGFAAEAWGDGWSVFGDGITVAQRGGGGFQTTLCNAKPTTYPPR